MRQGERLFGKVKRLTRFGTATTLEVAILRRESASRRLLLHGAIIATKATAIAEGNVVGSGDPLVSPRHGDGVCAGFGMCAQGSSCVWRGSCWGCDCDRGHFCELGGARLAALLHIWDLGSRPTCPSAALRLSVAGAAGSQANLPLEALTLRSTCSKVAVWLARLSKSSHGDVSGNLF